MNFFSYESIDAQTFLLDIIVGSKY